MTWGSTETMQVSNIGSRVTLPRKLFFVVISVQFTLLVLMIVYNASGSYIKNARYSNNLTERYLMRTSTHATSNTTKSSYRTTTSLSKNTTSTSADNEVANTFITRNRNLHASLPKCPLVPPYLQGKISVNLNEYDEKSIAGKLRFVKKGGVYKPKSCRSRHKVAIIIPYRNRKKHLRIFLNNMHPFLQKQQLEYGIFLIELAPDVVFNRALCMNIGFLEAKKYGYECFIFHDVDLIPENDNNLYTCLENPKHMSVAIDKFHYELPYRDIFGGVTAMNKEQFELVNGYSNKYFGWGAEDDDLYKRIRSLGVSITRYTPDVASYLMLAHAKDPNLNSNRMELLKKSGDRWREDGLNTIKYEVVTVQKSLYTYILADVDQNDIVYQPWTKGRGAESHNDSLDHETEEELLDKARYLLNKYSLDDTLVNNLKREFRFLNTSDVNIKDVAGIIKKIFPAKYPVPMEVPQLFTSSGNDRNIALQTRAKTTGSASSLHTPINRKQKTIEPTQVNHAEHTSVKPMQTHYAYKTAITSLQTQHHQLKVYGKQENPEQSQSEKGNQNSVAQLKTQVDKTVPTKLKYIVPHGTPLRSVHFDRARHDNQNFLNSVKQQENRNQDKSVQKQETQNTVKAVQKQEHQTSVKSVQKQENQIPVKSVQKQENQIPVKSVQKQENQIPVKSVQKQQNQIPVKSVQTQINQIPVKSLQKPENNIPVKSLQKQENHISVISVKKQEHQIPVQSVEKQENHISAKSLQKQENQIPVKSVQKQENQIPVKSLQKQENHIPVKSVHKQENQIPVQKQENQIPVKSVQKQENYVPVKSVQKQENQIPVQSLQKHENHIPVKSVQKQENHIPVKSLQKKENQIPVQLMQKQESQIPVKSVQKQEHQIPVKSLQKQENQMSGDSVSKQAILNSVNSVQKQENHTPVKSVHAQEINQDSILYVQTQAAKQNPGNSLKIQETQNSVHSVPARQENQNSSRSLQPQKDNENLNSVKTQLGDLNSKQNITTHQENSNPFHSVQLQDIQVQPKPVPSQPEHKDRKIQQQQNGRKEQSSYAQMQNQTEYSDSKKVDVGQHTLENKQVLDFQQFQKRFEVLKGKQGWKNMFVREDHKPRFNREQVFQEGSDHLRQNQAQRQAPGPVLSDNVESKQETPNDIKTSHIKTRRRHHHNSAEHRQSPR